MKFKDFILIGFSESQLKRIMRHIPQDADMTQYLLTDIADMTGHAVGMAFQPGGVMSIIRNNLSES